MGSEMRGREYLKEMSNIKTECKRLMKKYQTVSAEQTEVNRIKASLKEETDVLD